MSEKKEKILIERNGTRVFDQWCNRVWFVFDLTSFFVCLLTFLSSSTTILPSLQNFPIETSFFLIYFTFLLFYFHGYSRFSIDEVQIEYLKGQLLEREREREAKKSFYFHFFLSLRQKMFGYFFFFLLQKLQPSINI